MAKNKSREYTEEEVKAEFLRHVNRCIKYWENETREPTSLGKLKGLAHSIMTAIDEGTKNLPGFILAPDPDPDDKEYYKKNGRNYYPENHNSGVKCDIGGGLHKVLHEYEPEK
jgi:hypothetical protein